MQEPIGPYIVDFVSFEHRLIVEIDGGHQNDVEVRQEDDIRTAWLIGQGFQILRFWNNDVMANMDGIVAKIRNALELEC